MPSLTIPEAGVSFGSSRNASSRSNPVPDVFGLTLNDNVIEEMIRCVQAGKPIQLSLGDQPSLQYGSKIQHLSTSPNPFTHELYRSLDNESLDSTMSHTNPNPNRTGKIERIKAKPHTGFLAMFAPKKLVGIKKGGPTPKSSSLSTKLTSATRGTDAALAALQSSLASETQKKRENTTKFVTDSTPVQRGGSAKVTNKSKFLAQNRSLGNDASRSMPSSPALSGVGSPSLGATSIPLSQQQAEQAKASRKPVVHLLALQPMTEEDIREELPSYSNHDIRQALDKVGDVSNGKWELRKAFWKELDVWTYKYDTVEDRQRAIDNAVKHYDKMRLGVSEPEWDRLLPKSERGSGKCLSKLQAQIAQGTAARAPKISVHGAEDSGRDTPAGKDDEEDIFGDKNLSKTKGAENMARSVSQPPITKKKVGEKEAQAKRLLSKNPTKPTPKAAPVKKANTKTNFLSSQFVNESDEEEDDWATSTKPAPKAIKRSREADDGETSDSSAPLSKKVKKDNHRISNASQTSHTTNNSAYSSGSAKTKGNSPQKSSPLASSPPTNASEFENSSGGRTSSSASPAHSSTLKISCSPIHKRHQKSSSVTSSSSSTSQRSLRPEVIDIARKYRTYYPTYLALHKEVAAMKGRRNTDKEEKLLEMHDRLASMKKEILEGIIDSS